MAEPARASNAENVASIREFLSDTLNVVDHLRHNLRARLRAFDAAQDPEVQDVVAQAYKRVEGDDLPPVDAPDFLQKKLANLR